MEERIVFKENDLWLHEQLDSEEFQEEYENKFVAVVNNQLIASAETIEKLMASLNKLKMDISKVAVAFVYPKGVAVFF